MATTYKCPNCGNTVILEQPVETITCPYCNTSFNTAINQQPPQFGGNQQQYGQQQQQQYGYQQQPYGGHYLGKTTPGIVFLVASLISCGILAAVTSIIGLIQGIMMFTMSQQEFENKYVNPAVSFPLF